MGKTHLDGIYASTHIKIKVTQSIMLRCIKKWVFTIK